MNVIYATDSNAFLWNEGEGPWKVLVIFNQMEQNSLNYDRIISMTEAEKLPAPETNGKPKRVGCLLEKLDIELFKNVVDIYDNAFGGKGKVFVNNGDIRYIHQTLYRTNIAEFKYGSVFSENSKLEVTQQFSLEQRDTRKTVISFEFYENTHIRPENQAKLEEMRLGFDKSITNLLMEKKIALTLLD